MAEVVVEDVEWEDFHNNSDGDEDPLLDLDNVFFGKDVVAAEMRKNCFAVLDTYWHELIEDKYDTPQNGSKCQKVYDSESPWEFVRSWTNDVFERQFRITKEMFKRVVDRCKNAYPGRHKSGHDNYHEAQTRSKARSGRFVRIET
jgi:hypothetical protein